MSGGFSKSPKEKRILLHLVTKGEKEKRILLHFDPKWQNLFVEQGFFYIVEIIGLFGPQKN